MKRPLRAPLLAGLIVAMVACGDARTPIDPSRPRTAAVALAPRLIGREIGLQVSAPPIDQIRLTAKGVADGAELATKTVTVDPNATEWQLDMSIKLPDNKEVPVRVSIELLSSTAPGVVQWAGLTDEFILHAGPADAPVDVPVFRGPLENVGVTSVTISPHAPSVPEGTTSPLTAATTGGTTGTVVFWESLDPSVATVNASGVVSALVPGTARVVAVSGGHSDTITVTVLVKEQTVTLTPSGATLASIGATASFTAKVFDPRGAQITGATVTFTISPASVATVNSNGVVTAVGNGNATLTGTSGQGTTGTATVVVQQVASTVVITPSGATIPTVGGTTTLTATVKDANGIAIAGAPITWTSSAPTVASVGTTGVVTGLAIGVATITARNSATLAATAVVSVGDLFSDGFETPSLWIPSGIGIVLNGAGIVNTAFPSLVSTSGSTLPAAPQGSRYGWFGLPSQGNYMGTPASFNPSLGGGTSAAAQSGSLASAPFTVPVGVNTVFLSFQSWFEIESVAPGGFDLMAAELVDANTGGSLGGILLNTGLPSSSNTPATAMTSAGFGAAPAFVPIAVPVNNASGRSLRVLFTFATADVQFNGFRGWVIDAVKVTATQPPAGLRAPLSNGLLSNFTYGQLCNGACVRPISVRPLKGGN